VSLVKGNHFWPAGRTARSPDALTNAAAAKTAKTTPVNGARRLSRLTDMFALATSRDSRGKAFRDRYGLGRHLTVDEESLERAEQPLRPTREVRQKHQPVRQWLAGLPARQLLLADRAPELIDHPSGIAADLFG
jgi:hypothetical protein